MRKILLVEDNELNRDMLSRRLRKRGFEVALAPDGQQAIDIVPLFKPDLILMDMNLPIKDGWSSSREIKACPDNNNIPIIALTAHAMEGDRNKAIAAGCDAYETKPIDFPRLLEKINQLIK